MTGILTDKVHGTMVAVTVFDGAKTTPEVTVYVWPKDVQGFIDYYSEWMEEDKSKLFSIYKNDTQVL